MNEPSLYGISHSNRKMKDCWTKNTFNSSFPVALANYMRDRGIKANYISIDGDLKTSVSEIDVGDVYNAGGRPNSELYFAFEERYEPFQRYAYDEIDGIDLVVKGMDGEFLAPLEIKLTVIPDNSTKERPPAGWGSEIVVRPATTSYCAMGMFDSCREEAEEVRAILEPVCKKVERWDSSIEMLGMMGEFLSALDDFERRFHSKQRPFVMQPVWRTDGQSPYLDDDALDLFVWSDLAFTRLFLDESAGRSETALEIRERGKISRPMRCAIRTARCLYDLSTRGKANLEDIYRKMAFNVQTDKEFSASGQTTNHYMRCPRLSKPAIRKSDLFDIILNGGERMLKPERRFDQSIFFTMAGSRRL